MTTKGVEERLATLEKDNEFLQAQATELLHQIDRLRAVQEVQNLMGRYSFLHTANMQAETVELFAKHTPGTHVEMVQGVYDGFEGVQKCYLKAHAFLGEEWLNGAMFMHTLTTPVIEVAGDGMTAKGVWISPGHETGVRGDKAQANWAWCKYGADFVKEDGQWKIWHLHVYGIFMTPYEKSWVESSGEVEDALMNDNFLPEDCRPDRPPTHPTWVYKTTVRTEYVPVPPSPYETFDEKTAY